ncbi:MAG: 3-dehydroquinate synthase [Deltaproteobacteria bacterium]
MKKDTEESTVHTIHRNTDSFPSRILVGERLENLKHSLPAARSIIITDDTVGRLYPLDAVAAEIITIGTGEKIKTLDTVSHIYGRLLSCEADRSTFIVGVGGGIVCDVAGFAAATFLRGLRFGFVPTTLLAQADAAIGGKNGVNFEGYKNMVGVFQQPEFVICDPETLKTLPQREIANGLAEIVKHAAIADGAFFAYLERHADDILALKRGPMKRLVETSVRIKSAIVTKDEKEKGERRLLNFGHTFGHAIEKTTGSPHGEAVSRGMAVAAALSVKKGLLRASEEKRLTTLLKRLDLPVSLDLETRLLVEAIRKDKKRENNRIHFVLLKGIGSALVEKISLKELEDVVHG